MNLNVSALLALKFKILISGHGQSNHRIILHFQTTFNTDIVCIMVSQKDIYLTAQLVLKKHGQKAEGHALAMMQQFLKKDDVQGAGVWLSIMCAIDDLNKKKSQGMLN